MKTYGNVLENSIIVNSGNSVWFLRHKHGRIDLMADQGTIAAMFNIDNKGYANTYLDIINKKGKSFHVNIGQVYNHKPKLTLITDCYGETAQWV